TEEASNEDVMDAPGAREDRAVSAALPFATAPPRVAGPRIEPIPVAPPARPNGTNAPAKVRAEPLPPGGFAGAGEPMPNASAGSVEPVQAVSVGSDDAPAPPGRPGTVPPPPSKSFVPAFVAPPAPLPGSPARARSAGGGGARSAARPGAVRPAPARGGASTFGRVAA